MFQWSDNSNMAANLKDGRYRLPGNAMIYFLKMTANCQETWIGKIDVII